MLDRSDFDMLYQILQEVAYTAATRVTDRLDTLCQNTEENTRPSVLYRPVLSIDGDMWCALYGENLQDGVAGFGSTPMKALAAFDAAMDAETNKENGQ